MTVLLDTDILVDCLRGTQAARVWLESITTESFQIPGIVAMELVAGCRDQIELQRVQKFLGVFDVVWPEAIEFEKAYELLANYWLSSRLSIPDCVIAAMALTRSARLYTFNHKHFKSIATLDVQQPYSRD